MQEKHKELLVFMRDIVTGISEEKIELFSDFLKDIGTDEKDIAGVKVKDEAYKDVLKSLSYDKKVRAALLEAEPPDHIRESIEKTIKTLKEKAKEFFKSHNAERKASIKDRLDNSFSITAERGLFERDNRIARSEDDAYAFEISCYYRKENKRIEITLHSQFKVEGDSITSVGSDNFTIFDELAEHLGFRKADKSVQFNAIISDGEVSYNNDCDAYWTRHVDME
jgi:hypothetical protein